MSVNSFQEINIGGEYKFNVDNPDVLKRLSVDVYEDRLSGYRELITNATSAVRESIDEGYIDDNEGIINVEIDTSENKLIIEDNGIGISKERLDNVVTNIGSSTSREDIDKTGQYGMGFLSAFKLTGFDGGFKMITKSRDTGESYEGFWTNEGFNLYNEDIDTSYGTRFEINLNFNIDINQRRYTGNIHTSGVDIDKLTKITKYPRVNTSLEINSSDINFNEDWCNVEDITGTDNYIRIENEFFELLITDEDGYSDVVCLDSYINTRNVDIPDMGGYSLLRLKQEESIIVKGENKGDIVNNPDNADSKLWTPKPTGTRDILRNMTEKFNNWLYNTVTAYIENNIVRSDDLDKAYLGCKYMIYNDESPDTIIDNNELHNKFVREYNKIKILDDFDIESEKFVESDNAEIIGDVYMCKSPTNKVFDLLKKNDTVVKFTGNKSASDVYKIYGNLFGWEKLTDYNISDDLKMLKIYKCGGFSHGAFDISYDYLKDKEIDKQIVHCDEPCHLHKIDEDILTTSYENIFAIDNSVTIEEFANEYLSDKIINSSSVYQGSKKAYEFMDDMDDSVYVADLDQDSIRVIECSHSIDMKYLDNKNAFNHLINDVSDEDVKKILKSVNVRRLDIDEVIKLGNKLKNNI